jgi:hypothetical protein
MNFQPGVESGTATTGTSAPTNPQTNSSAATTVPESEVERALIREQLEKSSSLRLNNGVAAFTPKRTTRFGDRLEWLMLACNSGLRPGEQCMLEFRGHRSRPRLKPRAG